MPSLVVKRNDRYQNRILYIVICLTFETWGELFSETIRNSTGLAATELGGSLNRPNPLEPDPEFLIAWL